MFLLYPTYILSSMVSLYFTSHHSYPEIAFTYTSFTSLSLLHPSSPFHSPYLFFPSPVSSLSFVFLLRFMPYLKPFLTSPDFNSLVSCWTSISLIVSSIHMIHIFYVCKTPKLYTDIRVPSQMSDPEKVIIFPWLKIDWQ